MKKVKPEETLLESIANPDLESFTKEVLELGIDELSNNDLIKKIPVISIMAASHKTIIAVREYLLVKKIIHFLFQQTKISPKDRQKWLIKLTRKDERKKIGEVTLELIDKFTSTEKAQILGIFFRHQIKGTISTQEYIRIGEMIGAVYLSDIDYFLRKKEKDLEEIGDEVDHLLSTGFLFRGGNSFGGNLLPKLKPEHSSLGNIIYKILKEEYEGV